MIKRAKRLLRLSKNDLALSATVILRFPLSDLFNLI